MTPPAQRLRGLTRRLPPGPSDRRRTAGTENAVRRLTAPLSSSFSTASAPVVVLLALLFTGLRESLGSRPA